mmetsp:Transcript_19692/g.42392  ORF Transcript_19692/g.42392 Transcript_19692/m.42392 type:complete len:211 (+) Transcript_19692:1462-2094(+)
MEARLERATPTIIVWPRVLVYRLPISSMAKTIPPIGVSNAPEMPAAPPTTMRSWMSRAEASPPRSQPLRLSAAVMRGSLRRVASWIIKTKTEEEICTVGPSRPALAPLSCESNVSPNLPMMMLKEKMRPKLGSPSTRKRAPISIGMPDPAVPSKSTRDSMRMKGSPSGSVSHTNLGFASLTFSSKKSSTASEDTAKAAASTPTIIPPKPI